MFKVGLKKKKKGKKKKDQELFTEEELEQYKREHQHHPEGSASISTEEHTEKSENDDEWKQFAALTTGIDSILKKTQGDLDRIKETSFFKRVAPKRPEPVVLTEEKVQEKTKTPEEEAKVKQILNAVVNLSESEPESDDDAAFETDYINQVESGELPLAYVEDIEDEQDQGPDPFDTGYAEKVIKGPEVSQRGKKILNIGSAVEVLTGKVEVNASSTVQRRQRRGIQNLLLESFDVTEKESEGKKELDSVDVSKTLLDEPAELSTDAPIDLNSSLHLILKKDKTEGEEELNTPVISDDILKVVEFKVRSTSPQFKLEVDSVDWTEFEIQKDTKTTSVSPTKGSNLAVLLGEKESPQEEVDPFDTTYVEKIVPKPIEYDDDFDPRDQTPEKESQKKIGEVDDEDFDPRAGEEIDIFDTSKASRVLSASLLVTERKDLLNTSQPDISSTAPVLAPTGELIETEEEIDPFDTSAVEAIVAPGKTELKYLEKELLESDDDFDPRAGEEKPSAEELRRRKSSLSLTLSTPKGGVSFIVPTPDLLKTEADQSGKIQKPLTPYYHRESSLTVDEDIPEEDPFDTSYVSVVPTTIELEILEKEILKQPTIKQSLSDPDFDPRAVTPELKRSAEDILNAPDSHDIKVLTPARGDSICREESSEVDPFDTSAIAFQPGTTELKLLEDELIEKKPDPPLPIDIISDTQDNSIYDKILTPKPSSSIDLEADNDIDPFDTSFVSNLQPGETEIKLLENELIN